MTTINITKYDINTAFGKSSGKLETPLSLLTESSNTNSPTCKRVCYNGQKRRHICKKYVYRKGACYYHFKKTYPWLPRAYSRKSWSVKKTKKKTE